MTAAAQELQQIAAVDLTALAAAAKTLENANIAARIADYAGAPLHGVMALMPVFVDRRITKAAEGAMLRCLQTAIDTLDDRDQSPPPRWVSSMAAGLTGGVSGFVGLAALPVELPITATMMLRAIAAIARHKGENLQHMEARLACLQVFGLGGRRSGSMRGDIGYFAARTMLARAATGVTAEVVQRGAVSLSAPLGNSLISELAARFSLVVSDRIAASAVPIVGAIGGASLNVVFMSHFQRIAEAHFTVRRLERLYGSELVRQRYTELALAAQK